MTQLFSRVRGKLVETDWKGFSIWTKAKILTLFTLRPWHTWEKQPDLVLRAFELDHNQMCANKDIMDTIMNIKYHSKTCNTLMSLREMINIYQIVKKTVLLEGDLAEVGVYQGGSAQLICEAKGDKALHLFDTWEGLPQPDQKKDLLVEGDMNNTSLDLVKFNLESYKSVYFYKGIFPDTAGPIMDKTFSFVNLDTDLYSGTKACLEFFYPRMVKGGIIITHDYNDIRTPGVKDAFDEFFSDKPEFIFSHWDTQAMIVKT